jgi:hypothetical protein
MALAFGATILDGVHTKIFTMTANDNDGAGNLVVALDGAGGRPNAFTSGTPIDAKIVQTASVAGTTAYNYAITAIAANSVTIRKLTGGGGANAHTMRVTLRVIHSIDR